jgi:hypothetical protein
VSAFKRLGVFATPEQIQSIKACASAPVMYLSGGTPMGGDPVKETHRAALAQGLPEIPGYYGIDLRNGEFVVSA